MPHPLSARNTPDIMTGATWVLTGALAAIVLASSLLDGPSDVQTAQAVADDAEYAAALADGGAAKCSALGRTPIWTPEKHLICRLPAQALQNVTMARQDAR